MKDAWKGWGPTEWRCDLDQGFHNGTYMAMLNIRMPPTCYTRGFCTSINIVTIAYAHIIVQEWNDARISESYNRPLRIYSSLFRHVKWIWANQPIQLFFVGCLNPCLTSVQVGLPRAIKRLWDFLRKTKYCCVVEENIKVVKLFFFKEPHNIHPIVLSSFGKQTHTQE